MKNFVFTCCLLSIVLSNAVTATPTKIILISQNRTHNGDTYYVYQVECSDGRQPKIFNWDNSKQWCLGINSSHCEATRSKAATTACNSSS